MADYDIMPDFNAAGETQEGQEVLKKFVAVVAITASVGVLCSCNSNQLPGAALGLGVAVAFGVGLANTSARATPMPAIPSPQSVQVGNTSGSVPVSGQLSPTPKPTQGPVQYGGTGGQGSFGPFYLEAGIQRVKYTFRVDGAKLPGRDSSRYYFQAHLVGTKGSDFAKQIVVSSKDNLDDFNNIEVPYSGNYWIQIFDSEGAWQIDISPASSVAGGGPAGATPTPGASAAPSGDTSQLATITQFNAVSVGMTYEQVAAVMGSAGAKTYESSVGETVYSTYEWKMSGCSNSSSKGTVEFADGKVNRSYQYCQ